MDGNFALAPKQFQQLYVIRVQVNNVSTTAVYCLLQRKSMSTYESMLNTILKKCEENNLCIDPVIVHVDFERAMILAIKNVLGDHITIKGCFYHLTQSVHRKIQELGLENLYRNDEAFSEYCRKLDSLAFLPTTDVKAGMDYLKSVMCDDAIDLVTYFDSTYVNGTYRRIAQNDLSITLRNCPPMFPPNIWNVHESTLRNEDRTNNRTEGWNHRFSKLVGHNHPTVWTLITKIRLEVASDETKMAQDDIGRYEPKKKHTIYEKMQIKLITLCEDYKNGKRNLENFLTAVAHTIRYH